MIIGVDVGNFNTKTSNGIIFESKVSRTGNLLGSKYNCVLQGEGYKLSEGNFDTEFRKVNKENYFKLLFGALALSDAGREVELMLGLPISQYKSDRELLIEKVKEHHHMQGSLNNKAYDFYIIDVEVYPEAVASVSKNFSGIIVDIGGRTTDCCITYNKNEKRKIEDPISIAKGTLNLYADFINCINSKYSLDLKISDAERILRTGLRIEGQLMDIKFAKDIFRDFIRDLVNELKVNYSLNTYNVSFTGGGSVLLDGLITVLLPYAEVNKDGLFSNANGFYEYGKEIWR